MYKDESVVTKPEALSKRGGAFYSKIAIDLVTSLMGLNDQTHIVNVLAGDCVDGIGAGQVVEISAQITKDKIVPLKVDPPEPKILGLMQSVKAYENTSSRSGYFTQLRCRPDGAGDTSVVRSRKGQTRPGRSCENQQTGT